MKQDRFLLGILVGIGVLVLVALVLFFTRQDTQEYRADNTPDSVVHNYALALYRGDYTKAYGYLAEGEDKPTYNKFREYFFNTYRNTGDIGLKIGETEIEGDQAFVVLHLINSPGDPFSSGSRRTETARLERQSGDWKLLQMPYNFWDFAWYDESIK
jgi:hypothetical protein